MDCRRGFRDLSDQFSLRREPGLIERIKTKELNISLSKLVGALVPSHVERLTAVDDVLQRLMRLGLLNGDRPDAKSLPSLLAATCTPKTLRAAREGRPRNIMMPAAEKHKTIGDVVRRADKVLEGGDELPYSALVFVTINH